MKSTLHTSSIHSLRLKYVDSINTNHQYFPMNVFSPISKSEYSFSDSWLDMFGQHRTAHLNQNERNEKFERNVRELFNDLDVWGRPPLIGLIASTMKIVASVVILIFSTAKIFSDFSQTKKLAKISFVFFMSGCLQIIFNIAFFPYSLSDFSHTLEYNRLCLDLPKKDNYYVFNSIFKISDLLGRHPRFGKEHHEEDNRKIINSLYIDNALLFPLQASLFFVYSILIFTFCSLKLLCVTKRTFPQLMRKIKLAIMIHLCAYLYLTPLALILSPLARIYENDRMSKLLADDTRSLLGNTPCSDCFGLHPVNSNYDEENQRRRTFNTLQSIGELPLIGAISGVVQIIFGLYGLIQNQWNRCVHAHAEPRSYSVTWMISGMINTLSAASIIGIFLIKPFRDRHEFHRMDLQIG